MNVISVDMVSKKFRLSHDRPRHLADGLRNVLRRGSREDFWALKDVDFAVEAGEALGIIGTNGAGKSTMLKLLSNIMLPTTGRIRTRGRVSALIEIGAGFHPEMTGRENTYLNGSILGMTSREVAAKFDDIVAFAEIEKFIDIPVKRYSSGMYARLGFAVAAHVEPQILLVDEVLAVGDLRFQHKCYRHMEGLVAKGCSVIMVTHSLSAAKSVCDRLVWIHQGRIERAGTVDEVTRAYQDWTTRNSAALEEGVGGRWGTGEARILKVEAEAQRSASGSGFDIDVNMLVEADSPIDEPVLRVTIVDSEDYRICGATTLRQPGFLTRMGGKVSASCSFRDVPLMPGVYRILTGILDKSLTPLDRWEDSETVIIESGDVGPGLMGRDVDGLISVDADWRLLSSTNGHHSSGSSAEADPIQPTVDDYGDEQATQKMEDLPTDGKGIVLKCPSCGAALPAHGRDSIQCSSCDGSWPVVDGIVSLAHPSDFYHGELDQKTMRSLNADFHSHGRREAFERLCAALGPGPGVAEILEPALDELRFPWIALVGAREGDSVLDFGADWGNVSIQFAHRGCSVVAMDMSLDRLRFVRHRVDEEGLTNVELLHAGNRGTLPFPDHSFSVVVMNQLLEWLPQALGGNPYRAQAVVLAEAQRVLKPDGSLVVCVDNRGIWEYGAGLRYSAIAPRAAVDLVAPLIKRRSYRPYTHGPRVYQKMIEQAGFRMQEVMCPLPNYRVCQHMFDLSDPVASEYAVRELFECSGKTRAFLKMMLRLGALAAVVPSFIIFASNRDCQEDVA